LRDISKIIRGLPKGQRLGEALKNQKRHLLIAKAWTGITMDPEVRDTTLDSVYEYLGNRREMKTNWKEKKVKTKTEDTKHRMEIKKAQLEMYHQFTHKFQKAKAAGTMGRELQETMLRDYLTILIFKYHQLNRDAPPVQFSAIKASLLRDLAHVRENEMVDDQKAYEYMVEHVDKNHEWVEKILRQLEKRGKT
jgi:hypothetical protein